LGINAVDAGRQGQTRQIGLWGVGAGDTNGQQQRWQECQQRRRSRAGQSMQQDVHGGGQIAMGRGSVARS
jgi:hypothetical protein